ncbi:hypothetical protein Droror1_Dr00028253 [Drosera rotundifolia]
MDQSSSCTLEVGNTLHQRTSTRFAEKENVTVKSSGRVKWADEVERVEGEKTGLREPESKRKSSGHRRCHGAWGGRTTHQEKLRMSLVNVKLGVEKQVNKGKTPRKPNTPKKGGIFSNKVCAVCLRRKE